MSKPYYPSPTLTAPNESGTWTPDGDPTNTLLNGCPQDESAYYRDAASLLLKGTLEGNGDRWE